MKNNQLALFNFSFSSTGYVWCFSQKGGLSSWASQLQSYIHSHDVAWNLQAGYLLILMNLSWGTRCFGVFPFRNRESWSRIQLILCLN